MRRWGAGWWLDVLGGEEAVAEGQRCGCPHAGVCDNTPNRPQRVWGEHRAAKRVIVARRSKLRTPKRVEALTHEDASRRNIPTAEYQTALAADDRSPIQMVYERTTGTWTRSWCGAATGQGQV